MSALIEYINIEQSHHTSPYRDAECMATDTALTADEAYEKATSAIRNRRAGGADAFRVVEGGIVVRIGRPGTLDAD